MEPTRPLPQGWRPSHQQWVSLEKEFGTTVDLPLALRRFQNFYVEGQTSRNWPAKFENWVLSDVTKVRQTQREGTDERGIPYTQKKISRDPSPQPGDDDYIDWDAEARAACKAVDNRIPPKAETT